MANNFANDFVDTSNNDLHSNQRNTVGGEVDEVLWRDTLLAFSLNCSSIKEHDIKRLKNSNQILLPPSALYKISEMDNIEYPLFFKVTNIDNQFSQVCGVHEFTAPPGVCHLPFRIMDGLGIKEGNNIQLSLFSPVKGTFIKFQLHNSDFSKLSDPKAILEQKLSKYYPVLTEGHTISIDHLDKTYFIDVLKCEPCETIQIINTNINVDFEKPLDYVEPPPPVVEEIYDKVKFPGKGHKLGSC